MGQNTTVTMTCDNPACPNVGNYGALTPPLTTTDPTNWIHLWGLRAGRDETRIEVWACSRSCTRLALAQVSL